MATPRLWLLPFVYVTALPVLVTGGNRDVYREFKRDWCRERRARQDWRSISATCKGRAREWGYENWPKDSRTNANESYIAWVDPKPAGQFTKIYIQTVSMKNKSKHIGGDSWRIKVTGRSSQMGSMYDLGNGTYEMALLLSDSGTYMVQLTLDYSLCHGLKNPPYNWFRRGCRHGSFQPEGSLQSEDDYIDQTFRQGSIITMTVKEPPTQNKKELLMADTDSQNWCPENCTLVWDGFGRWRDNEWQPFLQEIRSPPTSGHVIGTGVLWIYGDSVNRLFYEALQARPICTQVFRACYYTPVWVYILHGDPQKETNLNYGGNELNITTVLEELQSVVRQPCMNEHSALLVNTGIHLLKSTTFLNYQNIIKGMIKVLKANYRGRVVWKTITSLGEQTYLYSGCARRFHTEQRIKLFNAYAMNKMCKAGFAVLDVYPLSSGYPEGTYDGIHHRERVFYPAERALETYFRNQG